MTRSGSYEFLQKLQFKNSTVRWENIKLSLRGDFQKRNAAVVLQVTSLLKQRGLKISELHIRNALANTFWPGRLECVSQRPIIFLDGAHNPEGIFALTQFLKQQFPHQKIHVVFGVMKDKNYRLMTQILFNSVDHIYFVEPHLERALKGDRLLRHMPAVQPKIEVYSDIQSSLPQILRKVDQKDIVCITGSLYTVAEAKTFFQ